MRTRPWRGEVLGQTFLAEDSAHEVEVPAAPFERRRERERGAELVERDGTEHLLVHDDRDVERGADGPRADLILRPLELLGARGGRRGDEAVARILRGRALRLRGARGGVHRGPVDGDAVPPPARERAVGRVPGARGRPERLGGAEERRARSRPLPQANAFLVEEVGRWVRAESAAASGDGGAGAAAVPAGGADAQRIAARAPRAARKRAVFIRRGR